MPIFGVQVDLLEELSFGEVLFGGDFLGETTLWRGLGLQQSLVATTEAISPLSFGDILFGDTFPQEETTLHEIDLCCIPEEIVVVSFLSSKLYPIYVPEFMQTGGELLDWKWQELSWQEALDVVGVLLDGTLVDVVFHFYSIPIEALDVVGVLLDGTLVEIVFHYYAIPSEAIDPTGVLLNGTLENKLITYLNWPVESIDTTGTLLDGTLT